MILLDGDCSAIEEQARRDVRLLLLEELLERAVTQMTIVWVIADEFEKDTGQPNRIALCHELADLIVVRAGSSH